MKNTTYGKKYGKKTAKSIVKNNAPKGRCAPESFPAFPAGTCPTAPAALRVCVRCPAAALPAQPAANFFYFHIISTFLYLQLELEKN